MEEGYAEVEEEELISAAEPEGTPQQIASVLSKAIDISAATKVDKPVVDEVTFDEQPLTPKAPATATTTHASLVEPTSTKKDSLLKKLTRALTDSGSVPSAKSVPVNDTVVVARTPESAPVVQESEQSALGNSSIAHSTVAFSPVKSKSANVEQPMLALASNNRSSHFKDADQNIVQGEDLDTPTWMRLRRKVSR
jgi:hypothetical protein